MRQLSAQRFLASLIRSRICAAGAGLMVGAAMALPLVIGDSSASAAHEMLALSVERESEPNIIIETALERPLDERGFIAPVATFDHRPIRRARTITMRVTAYSPDARSCGPDAQGITASGYSVFTNAGKLVAADTSVLPFGSLISVPGYDGDAVVPVLDRGGAIKGNRLDVLFPTHEEALAWGVRDLEVTVWEYADGEPNGFRENHWHWKLTRR